MKLKRLISDFSNTPVSFYLPKFLSNIEERRKKTNSFKKDVEQTSFAQRKHQEWNALFTLADFELNDHVKEASKLLCSYYLAHKFDIFGSGWNSFSLSHGNGFDAEGDWLKSYVNSSNLSTSKYIWKEIQNLNPTYDPIHWQIDIKSSYVFKSNIHFSKTETIIERDGVDVKYPWELGRLQHLPELALTAQYQKDTNELFLETQCQILDFIMSNPPRWGVHWTSAMEVSIRLMNMVIAVNHLIEIDPELVKTNFYAIFTTSIENHLIHSWDFREHKNGLGNNHYLANLTGVLYGAFATKKSTFSSDLLRKASVEMLIEIDRQFLEDGGNFESSLTYHSFSSEISVLALALISKLKDAGFFEVQKGFSEKLRTAEAKISKALNLLEWARINNGVIPQIGDNDSARMLYWNYPYQTKDQGPDRDYLNYDSSIDMLRAYFGKETQSIHGYFIKTLLGGSHIELLPTDENLLVYAHHTRAMKYSEETFYEASEFNLLNNIRSKAFPDFGIYLFKSDDLFLLVNGTNRRVAQYWPHSHNDKASFELWMGGKPIVRDPGSFTYTGFPEIRNAYRSIKAHATVIFGQEEQNNYLSGIDGVFRMKPETKVELLNFNKNGIKLKTTYRKYVHIREIIIEEHRVLVKDFGNHAFKVNKYPEITFSNGYGKLES